MFGNKNNLLFGLIFLNLILCLDVFAAERDFLKLENDPAKLQFCLSARRTLRGSVSNSDKPVNMIEYAVKHGCMTNYYKSCLITRDTHTYNFELGTYYVLGRQVSKEESDLAGFIFSQRTLAGLLSRTKDQFRWLEDKYR